MSAPDVRFRVPVPVFAVLPLLVPGHFVAADGPSSVPGFSGPAFLEARDTGFDFVHFNGRTGRFYMAEINGGGGGMADVDGDGDLDLYLVQGQALEPGTEEPPRSDRLYRNLLVESGELRFRDVTETSGIAPRAYGFGVAAGDVDGDGDIDLYVTRYGSNTLWSNRGDGTFEDTTTRAGVDDVRWSVASTLVDVDRDGDLDLFVGNYVDFTLDNHRVCRAANGAQDYCGPGAYAGIPNRLFRNRGDGTFEDVSVAAGLAAVPSKTLGVVARDFDADGRIDFYVTNDLEANQLWLQQPGGGFRDEALLAGAAVNAKGEAEASMGVDAADVDGDGDEDLVMTHLVGETNTFYRNEGGGLFVDATIESGLGAPSWGFTSWGTAWLDFDNDGWLDLAVANGAVRVREELARAGDPFPFHEPNQLFRNRGRGAFVDVSEEAGPAFQRSETSRALATGDLDSDGDPDLLIVNNNGPARLLLNRIGQDRSWIGFRVLDARGGPALGARVEVRTPSSPPRWRRVRVDGSFAATNDPRVLVGLGNDPRIERVLVHWPDGSVATWTDLQAGRYHELRPPVAPETSPP